MGTRSITTDHGHNRLTVSTTKKAPPEFLEALALVLWHRAKQISKYPPEHDDGHAAGELAEAAAVCVGWPQSEIRNVPGTPAWVWTQAKKREGDRISQLAVGVAFALAELERLIRAQRAANPAAAPLVGFTPRRPGKKPAELPAPEPAGIGDVGFNAQGIRMGKQPVSMDFGTFDFHGVACEVMAVLDPENFRRALRFRNSGHAGVAKIKAGKRVRIVRETAGMIIDVRPVNVVTSGKKK